ncbi:MAG: tetratricopeptide repeat protein [Zetaproteobacteria bacterium]|nr:tetratricopeptide repeat protein [Zetaproteobacteria bacterium]
MKRKHAHNPRKSAVSHAKLQRKLQPLFTQALAYHQAGRLVEAEALYRQILSQDERHVDALHLLGVAASQMGHHELSVELIQRAIALKPNIADFYSNLANVLKAQGKLDEAITYYEQALGLKPDYPDALSNLGAVLHMQGRLDEATARYEQVLMLKPNHPGALLNFGNTLRAQGKLNEAICCFEQALTIHPRFAECHHLLSQLKTYAPDDPQIPMLHRLHAEVVNASERVHVCFALAKVNEDLKAFDESFSLYVEGNQLQKKSLSYKIDDDQKLFEQIKLAFAVIPPAKDLPRQGVNPILIVGMPRSGTSLVEQILASHSEVFGAGELEAMNAITLACFPDVAAADFDILVSSQKITASYLEVLNKVAGSYQFVTDKMPLNFRLLGFLMLALPELRIVHMKRDPMAVCWSNFRKLFPADGLGFVYDLDDLAEYYRMYEGLMQFWHVRFPGRIYDLSYEQLTEHQEDETRKLLDYCGLAWQDHCLEFEKTERAVRTASAVQVRDKMYQGSSQAWRKFEVHLQPLQEMLRKGFESPPQGSLREVPQLFAQALAHHRGGQLAEAEDIYRQILSKDEHHVDALHLLGVVNYQCGEYELAVEWIDRAIALNPSNGIFHSNLGNVFKEQGKLDAAQICYEQALMLKPDFAEVLSNLGVVLKAQGKLDEAITRYEQALSFKPDYPRVLFNLGNALSDQGKLDEAIARYDQAVTFKPDYDEAYSNRGHALKELKRLEEALASYEQALICNPNHEFLLGTKLHVQMHLCDWRGLNETLSKIELAIVQGMKVILPFQLLGLQDDRYLQCKSSKIYIDEKHPMQDGAGLGLIERHRPHEKIRIGYYSADFQDHAVAVAIAGLFERHDRSRFEVYGFSLVPNADDEMHRRIVTAFDHYIDTSRVSDRDVAKLSRELGIDIAIDLGGHTIGARTGIFCERAAPIQVNYLGYPGTMGADYMDYIIADKITIPPQWRAGFTEKVVYLPHSFFVNDCQRPISERRFTRQELGLPDDKFVFCCFNSSYKILPATFAGWMRILKAVDGSVLWLSDAGAIATTNLRKEAELRGVDSNRLVFAKKIAALDEHLARYRYADLFIDTLPYNAHMTACDALWAGLPVLTCVGNAFASRVAASLLNAIGISELVTQTQAEYEAKAVDLAMHPEILCKIKDKLTHNRQISPLFNSQLFAHHIEAAYETMYERYVDGKTPDHFDVESQS